MTDPSLQQRQEQRQEQVIAPHQIHSLEYLMAQAAELETLLNRELEENPVLEIEEPGSDSDNQRYEEQSADEIEEVADQNIKNDNVPDTENDIGEVLVKTYSSSISDESKDKDISEDADTAEFLSAMHDERDEENYSTRVFDEEFEEKRQHFFDSLTRESSLQEQLIEQLHLLSLDEEKSKLVELVIGSIDDTGYLKSHPADIATVAGVSIEEVEEAIKIVQKFDPPGVGARDLKECLLLQLESAGKGKSKAAYLIRHHLDDLISNRLPQISKKMGLSLEDLHKVIDEIRNLNPKPGLSVSPGNPIFVVPDVFVERKGDEFIVRLNKDALPRLRISRTYMNMLEDPNVSREVKTYIKEKILRAKNLMRSLAQRESTIKRIADVIVDEQYNFFKHGVEHLKPLTMQQVADKLGLHETTVSRATANKYMQTEHGLFEFKFFFSTGYKDSSGAETSSRSVMEKIKDMIDKEDPSNPLSDSEIAELLKKEGLNVARRTVAKYREVLGIPSSHMRKQHI